MTAHRGSTPDFNRSGKGNVFLESAAPLARSLHQEIISLGRRLETAAEVEEDSHRSRPQTNSSKDRHQQLLTVIAKIKELLSRIDREVPLLQLAISASGESLSTSLPAGISPSRLLQASTFLIVGDTQFAQNSSRPVQIGPAFTLSLYMLFLGHAATHKTPKSSPIDPIISREEPSSKQATDTRPYGVGEGDRKPLWQEVMHKARVRLCRIRSGYAFDGISGYRPKNEALAQFQNHFEGGYEYSYHLELVEDLNDGRLHDEERKGRPYDDITSAGIRESIPIHQLSKIFYTDTGRILNVGSAADGENNPVLLLKRDVQAPATRPSIDPLAGYLETTDMVESLDSSHDGDEQFDIDRQIQEELGTGASEIEKSRGTSSNATWNFPTHLDPEWIALEVYEEDEDDEDSSDTDDDDEFDVPLNHQGFQHMAPRLGDARNRSSLDSRVVDQIKNLSLQSSVDGPSPSSSHRGSSRDLVSDAAATQEFVARSPFGAITSSLSLMEMLIRLTSLQEFQQASHLSIPDHILSFFLEETSTTGLVGESQWKARSEAKRRMGFDPYTDSN